MSVTCRDFVEFLEGYLAGDLAAARQAEFERHLVLCPPCVAYMRTYRETIRLGKSAFPDLDAPVTPEVPEELLAAILQARPKTT